MIVKIKSILFTGLVTLILLIEGCKNSEILPVKYYPCGCDNIKILKDEPAYIKYNNLSETLTIELVNTEFLNGTFLIPCDDSLPEEYRIEGLPVFISGEVAVCSENLPNAKTIPWFTIKLSTIKKRNART